MTPADAAFGLADLLARRGRLIDLSSDVRAEPVTRGDHLLNPDMGEAVLGRPLKDAAVLVPLVAREGPLGALLTLRAAHLAAHAAQVAFPGGKIDPGDPDPAAAALREAAEEIGLDPAHAEPIGYGTPYVSGSGYRIFPLIALVDPAAPLTRNPDEVDAVFEVPWSFLMEPANHVRASRAIGETRRHFYRMPWGEHVIWGVTAGIVRALYEQLYD